MTKSLASKPVLDNQAPDWTALFLMCCLSWVISALLVDRKVSPMRSRTSGSTTVNQAQEILCCE
jgi:hypothetical protein